MSETRPESTSLPYAGSSAGVTAGCPGPVATAARSVTNSQPSGEPDLPPSSVQPTRTTTPRSGSSWAGRLGRGLSGLAAAAGLWWLTTDVVALPGSLLANFGPVEAVGALTSFLTVGGVEHLGVTLQRLGVGLLAAALIGVPAGVATGLSRSLEEATGPLFQFVRMISPLAWTPIAIILFGVGDLPVYFLVGVAAVWPVILNTAAGVHALDPGWLLVARSLGATRGELLRTIVIPGIRGHVVTGLRVALGIAWVVIVPAEMLGVDSGLGYAILDARDRLSYDELMGIIVLIGIVGFVLDAAAKRLVGATARRRAG